MLVNDRLGGKAGRVLVERGIKGFIGMVRKGEGTRAVNGGRCAHTGRPEPVAIADQDRPPAVTPPPSPRGAGSS